jgi:SAM-dependent methyltransferase
MKGSASSKDERQTLSDFSVRYSRAASLVLDEIEARVIGGAWGANGFTTMSQADLLGERLGLGPGRTLLDIGTGRGWPGLYLAERTGCEVVLADLPIEGLRIALARAGREDLLCLGGVVASARYPAFAAGSFDAVVHTDVLC